MGNGHSRQHPIKVGIIGGGYGISTLLPAISTLDEFQVVAVARSDDRARGLEYGDFLTDAVMFTTPTEIIESKRIDLVVIASPPRSHEKYAVAALENGKSIYCEKPGGINVAATRRISKAVDQYGGHATIGFQFRYDPMIRWLIKRCSDGSLGLINRVHVQWETSGASKTPVSSWRNDRETGGGVLRDFATHIFDYMAVINPSNFNSFDLEGGSDLRNVRSNISQWDIQEIDFSARIGCVQFNCQVSRKVVHPLGHRIRIEGDKGIVEGVHKTPFDPKDISARFWSGGDEREVECSHELLLDDVTMNLERHKLNLRQLAVRNLFSDFALSMNGVTVPYLPNFVQGISNQLHIEEVEKVLFPD